MLVFLVLCVVACFVYACCVKPQLRKRCDDDIIHPPLVAGAWPIIGHAYDIIRDTNAINVWNVFKGYGEESIRKGGAAMFAVFTVKCYVLSDLDDSLLVANTCLQKDEFYDFARSWLGNGLLTAKVPSWKLHRKLLNPAFNQRVIDGYLGVFNSRARILVDKLRKNVGNGPFDHMPYLAHTTLEIICCSTMGLNESADNSILNNTEYVKCVNKYTDALIQRAMKIWYHNDFIYNMSNAKRKHNNTLKILNNMTDLVIKERKLQIENSDRKTTATPDTTLKSYLDVLMDLSAQGALSYQDVRDEVATMVVGGYDTNAHALTLILVMLGSFPEVESRVFEELKEVFGDHNRDVEKKDLVRLEYLDAVIKESMRLYSPVPVIMRYIDEDIKLSKYTLLAGRKCLIHVHALNRNPKIWGPDADQFKPERWLGPANSREKWQSFLSFSIGKRACIGKTFAMMSMKTVLIHILRRYTVKGDHTQMTLKLDLFLTPVSGHHISLEDRLLDAPKAVGDSTHFGTLSSSNF